MAVPSRQDVTQLLMAWGDGDQSALEELVPLVEAELHRLAQRYLRREQPSHTLQPTALVNEVYLRLMDWKNVRSIGKISEACKVGERPVLRQVNFG